jgi:hypothetical protein
MIVKRWIRWLPALIWMAVIFISSGQTGDDMGVLLPFFQNLFPAMTDFNWGHFIAYFILAWTFYFALGAYGTLRSKALVVFLCFLYGITDEYHQSFVPGRYPDLLDLRNDTIGAALAMLVATIPMIDRWMKRKL